ncbi:hypothetical protein DFJ73DRAFT_287490 [Zopfochytrium polystomum]|nr:hypothetical protein DFJ73DRAFT_287490 [Zopfochytrium polystomum]
MLGRSSRATETDRPGDRHIYTGPQHQMLRGSIAEAADRRLLRRLRSATTTTTTSTPSALLLLVVDRASFDALQWSCPASATAASGSSTPGGLAALLGAGADANAVARVLFIEDLDTRPAALPDLAADLAASLSASPATATPANHAVFLLSSHLARHADAVRAVLLAHPFAACSVFATALSELAHAHELERDTDLLSAFDAYLGVPAAGYFAGVESKLYEWMVEGGGGARGSGGRERRPRFDDGEDDDLDNPYAGGGDGDFDVLVTHLPLFSVATITNDLFTIPSSETVFPSLHAPNLAARSLDAPSSFDRQTRQLAYTLSTLLDDLSLKDELFVLGNYSKSIARCMVAQSLHSPRRTSDRGAAVILIDRTLDLAAPLAHSDNLLDHINRLLEHRSFGQSFDVDVPLDLLLADAEDSLGQSCWLKLTHLMLNISLPPQIVYASLAHGADSEALDLLTVLSTLSQKDGLVVVRKRLVDLLIRVRPDLTASRPRVLGKLTLAQLEGFLKSVRGDEAVLARHGPMLQCVAAAAAAMRAGQSSRWEDLMGIEKLIGLTLSECLDGSNIIAPVLDVLSQVDVGA